MSNAKKCKVGYPCGKSCISKLRKCWNNLPKEGANKQFETFYMFVTRMEKMVEDELFEIGMNNTATTPETDKVTDFNINQELTNDMYIGDGAYAVVYKVGDAVIKEGTIGTEEVEILEYLTEKGFNHAPELLGKTKTRLAMREAPGIVVDNQLDELDDNDRQKILDSVKALHELNVAHGDLHGYNIMYDKKTSQSTLIDFGYGTKPEDDNIKSKKLQDALDVQYLVGMQNSKKTDKVQSLFKQYLGGDKYTMLGAYNAIPDIAKNDKKYKELLAELYTI